MFRSRQDVHDKSAAFPQDMCSQNMRKFMSYLSHERKGEAGWTPFGAQGTLAPTKPYQAEAYSVTWSPSG